jgi:hypothetical protein
MNNIETRIKMLEKERGGPEQPWLLVLPEDTFENVKAQYQELTGQEVTDEGFKRLLPTLNLILLNEVNRESETRTASWLRR